MKVIGIIPARGGSRRIPKKNIADLGGKPLLRWSIDAAVESDVFSDIFVSTEDEEIGAIAGEYWWKRPPELAKDDSPSWPIIIDIVKKVSGDIFVLLQPTSPFRTAEDICAALNLLLTTNADSIISVKDAPMDLVFEVGWAKRLRQLPNLVTPNGALYLITAQAIEKGENWYSGLVYGYSMPKDRSFDIDTELDLQLARHMLHLNGHQ